VLYLARVDNVSDLDNIIETTSKSSIKGFF